MKKFSVILTILIVSTMNSFSEKISLCKAFEKLFESSKNGFSDLKLEATSSSNSAIGEYSSSIEIDKAEKTTILYVSSYQFIADYGKFNSEEEAKTKVEELKNEFINCYPVFKFTDYYPDILKSLVCNFVQYSDKGFRIYKAHFEIQQWGKTYTVTFHYPAYKKATTGYFTASPEVTCYTDYYYFDKQKGYDQFSLDIRKVLEDAVNGFKSIKGSEIQTSDYISKEFEAKFNVTGYSNCYIQDRTMSPSCYVIPCLKSADLETTKKVSEDVISKIQTALGSDYGTLTSSDGMRINFANKYNPQNNIITIVLEPKKGDTYNFTILINSVDKYKTE